MSNKIKLVKINSENYINPEHVESVSNEGENPIVYMTGTYGNGSRIFHISNLSFEEIIKLLTR